MTAYLLPEGKQSFETSAGAPLVGGKLYTYQAGTTTPLATYSDANMTSPNTNPVILDARGEATIYWHGDYKVVLKDATGVTIWTVDPVSAPVGGGGGGGTVTSVAAGYGTTFTTITSAGAVDVDPTVIATLSTAQTLTNKVIDGALNTLTVRAGSDITGTLAVVNGGTGGNTQALARTGLGATTVGSNVFTAVDAAAARTAIGAGTGNGDVTLTGTQTLTNKTLTLPIIATIANGGTLTLPSGTRTIVARDTTDTLTNKTISGASNTLTNIAISSLTGGPLAVSFGGTGGSSFTSGQYLKGAGTGAFTSVATIPYTDITGTATLGTGLNGGATLVGTGTVKIADTAVTPGAYGSSTLIPIITVDQQGRVTSASTTGISGAAGGTVTSVTAGTGLTGTPNPIIGAGTLAITATGVTAASYGNSTSIPVITVNAQGQITAASTVGVSGAAGGTISLITNTGTGLTLTNAAGPTTNIDLDTTIVATLTGSQTLTNKTMSGASNTFSNIPYTAVTGTVTVGTGLTGGTIVGTGTVSLTNTGVSLGTYGSSSLIPVITVDAQGRITSATTAAAPVGTISSITNTGGGLTITNGTGPTANIDITAPIATSLGGTGLLVPFYVATIAAMVALAKASLVNGQPCIVLGYGAAGDGGGDPFYWDSASTQTTDTGTCFQAAAGGVGRWLRLIDDPGIDILWFGADRTGATSSSTAFNNAYTYADSVSANYSRSVFAPAGSYLISSNLTDNLVGVKGEGYAGTTFLPTTTTGSCLTLTDTSGTLLPAFIVDIGFNGTGTRQGVGIDHIAGSGRAIVERSYIRNFDKGINRSTGNFQEWYRDVSMANNNYHIYSASTASAQAGSLIVEGGNYGTAEYAANYINGTTEQSGQFIYKQVFWQGAANGWCFFVKAANTLVSPSIELDGCYLENVYKSVAITIDSYNHIPQFAYIENCNMFRILNMTPGGMILVNSNVETTSADLSYINNSTEATTIDATSTMLHYQARWSNGYNISGMVYSVSDITAATPAVGTGSWYQSPQLEIVTKVPGATTAIKNDCSAPISFVGSAFTTTNATDTGIAGLTTCQDLAIVYSGTAINTESPDSGAGSIAAGTYIAWVWVGKLISGTAPDMYLWGSLVGGTQLTVLKKADSADFVTLKGMNYLTAACNHISLEYRATASGTVRMAGYAVMTFTDKQRAMDWLNSKIFPS